VTVTGSNLDSVAEPRITVTVVITTSYNDTTNSTSSKNETDSEVINDDGGSLQTYERFVACKCQIQSRSCFFGLWCNTVTSSQQSTFRRFAAKCYHLFLLFCNYKCKLLRKFLTFIRMATINKVIRQWAASGVKSLSRGLLVDTVL